MNKFGKQKILVVDDDTALLANVKGHLEKAGFDVAVVADARTAIAEVAATEYDLVVLDIYFVERTVARGGSVDGIEVLRVIRESGNVPVIMLSATNVSAVKVMALTIGADDYVSKPFNLPELTARIEAVLRRSNADNSVGRVLSFRRVRLDPGERRVWKDGEAVELTGIEFDILHTLARRPEHVFTREKLIEAAWKEESYCVPKAVDVHIGHIRKKLEDNPARPAFIVTVRGTGYRFEDGDTTP